MIKIITALDFDDINKARHFVSKLTPDVCRLKVGMQMFTAFGPAWVEELQEKGFEIFLDLKFHDIPSTVAKACVSAAALGVWMCNIHVCGGTRMMQSAREALDHLDKKPLLIGVTVLTSSDDPDAASQVLDYAIEAKQAGLDGVVCSAHEAAVLRTQLGPDFVLVTPGIRLKGDALDDQSRVMTPEAAIEAGSDYLVIGRSITQAENPLAVLKSI